MRNRRKRLEYLVGVGNLDRMGVISVSYSCVIHHQISVIKNEY